MLIIYHGKAGKSQEEFSNLSFTKSCEESPPLVHYPKPQFQIVMYAVKYAAKMADIFYNTAVNDVCVKGKYPEGYVDKLKSEGYDLSYMLEEDEKVFKEGTVDYLGVNTYERVLAKPSDSNDSEINVNNTGNSTNQGTIDIKGWFEYWYHENENSGRSQ
ncbi:MAG TPA: family 1 glycosylhydrolase [Clostridiales bacterium]|nr:family 1 glycosylhydrolase [Clostridiales bacterium]